MHPLPTERELIDAVASKIAAVPIEAHPFPHIIVDQLLPGDVYDAVLGAIPPLSEFVVVDYPGTGFGRRGDRYHDFGYAYGGFHEARGALGLLNTLFASEQFGRALLDKFSRPLPDGLIPIPRAKHEFFAAGAHDYATVFDLQVDLPGYAIAPHKDLQSKIVTFQLYLTQDAILADYGTLLCEPKDNRASRGRGRLARLVGRGIRGLPRDNPRYSERREAGSVRPFDGLKGADSGSRWESGRR